MVPGGQERATSSTSPAGHGAVAAGAYSEQPTREAQRVGQIGPGFLSLPYRTPKPRSDGLTHVLDKGLSLFALESLIEVPGGSDRCQTPI